jgi:hypothetical protein
MKSAGVAASWIASRKSTRRVAWGFLALHLSNGPKVARTASGLRQSRSAMLETCVTGQYSVYQVILTRTKETTTTGKLENDRLTVDFIYGKSNESFTSILSKECLSIPRIPGSFRASSWKSRMVNFIALIW